MKAGSPLFHGASKIGLKIKYLTTLSVRRAPATLGPYVSSGTDAFLKLASTQQFAGFLTQRNVGKVVVRVSALRRRWSPYGL